MTDIESLLGPKEKYRFTKTLIIATTVACMGSLQYGYHIAELNAPQQVMTCNNTHSFNGQYADCIELSNQQFGIITAIFSIGGLCGSLVAGRFADKYGRLKTAILANVINFVSSLIMFSSNRFRQLFMGRIGVGFACGLNIVITPLYINEIAPTSLRGSLGTMNQFCINLGILLTQSVAIKYATINHWRNILFIGSILSVVNIIGWFTICESPRWLLSKNQFNSAYFSLSHIREISIEEAKMEIEGWQREHSNATDNTNTTRTPSNSTNNINDDSNDSDITMWRYLTSPRYSKSRTVITAILVGQQFCGINSIIFYGVKVVSQLLPDQALLINFSISIINVIITFLSSILIERFGRKPLLMSSTIFMSIMSILISLSIVKHISVLLIISIFVYIGFFAIGIGPIPFLIIGELSGKQDKAIAQSYGTVCNWLATFIIGYGFPILNDYVGGYVYLLFAMFALWFTNYIHHKVPETKNKTQHDEIWNGY
ncbi:Vvs1p PWA37_004993 [Arxiozyma heterogenica]|uniref:Major facilitator superfamily (MFS) profile domain-containing protein n=1 Tax=Arxiozyma heterogenica TaxID=278026 RepID=A0AAN7WG12_9SACH|nr:hypothetical protein RI543_005019 [Kazachstania heterogenica]